MRQRTITAIFFSAAMLGGIYGGRETFYALFLFITAGALWELQELLLPKDEPHRKTRKALSVLVGLLPVLLSGMLILFSATCGNSSVQEGTSAFKEHHLLAAAYLLSLLAVVVPTLIAVELFLASKTPFHFIGYCLTGLFYIGLPIALLFSMSSPEAIYTPNRVIGLLLLVWTNDVGAYLIGSQIGKTKLFERISPKKTWEGTTGGAIFTGIIAWGLSFVIKDFTLVQWLSLSVVAAIGSNVGDLVESMLKRSANVKDSGTLLPGHGGLLDRFDAFIFCLPFYWLVLQLV